MLYSGSRVLVIDYNQSSFEILRDTIIDCGKSFIDYSRKINNNYLPKWMEVANSGYSPRPQYILKQ